MKIRTRSSHLFTVLLFCLIVLLSACVSLPDAPTPTPPPTQTPTPFPDSACGWQWAYKDLPEMTEQWRDALTKLSLPLIVEQTTVNAFGENCFGPNGEVMRFAGMETDFNIGLTVHDINDMNERAARVEPVMRLVIDSFSSVSPRPGFVEFRLQSATEQQGLRITVANAESVFAEGKTGIGFYNAVISQP